MTSQGKQAGIWALYDYAGAFAAAVFAIYFSQWLVIDHHVSDLKFNMIFVISSFLLLISAPLFGIMVDRVRVKLPALRLVTVFSFISLIAVGALAQFAPPKMMVINIVIAFLIIGQYFYQLSFVFYDPLLKELGDETQQARISGFGEGAAWFGQLSGLIITLPLATGAIYLLGHRDESQVFIPTALVFLALVLPMMFFFKERSQRAKVTRLDLKKEVGGILRHFLELKKYPGVHRFLLAFFFFNDAVLTAGHNFPIYVERVFHADNQTKVILLGSILVAAAIGAVFSGYLANRVGEKRLLLLLLASWVVILPITALQTELPEFIVCMACIGLLLGATGAISRAVMTYLSPPQEIAHIFGYYSMASRLASFLGPLSWGLITHQFLRHGAERYQVALGSMAVFVLVGFFILRDIPSDSSSLVAQV